MRILLLVPQLPFPPTKGASMRTWHFVRWLAKTHEVSLLAFAAPAPTPPELRALCQEVRTVPPPARTAKRRLIDLATNSLPDLALRLRSREYELALAGWLDEEVFDVVQVESLEMSLAWLRVRAGLATGKSRPWSVLDELNAEYLLQWRAFRTDLGQARRWPLALYSLIQTFKLRMYERRVSRHFDRVLAVSNEDAKDLRALDHKLRPLVVPNGVDCEYFAFSEPAQANQMIFTGTMDFRPNVDAVVWFATEILPLVRAKVPDATFTIVGANPSPGVRALAVRPGVAVTGAVPDVRPYMTQGAVYVIPMRIGGGVRLKALEAMAAGIPIVSTSLGFSGISALPGEHFLAADTPADFAAAAIRLLEKQYETAAMTKAARRLVAEHFDWSVICPRLAPAYLRRLESPSTSAG